LLVSILRGVAIMVALVSEMREPFASEVLLLIREPERLADGSSGTRSMTLSFSSFWTVIRWAEGSGRGGLLDIRTRVVLADRDSLLMDTRAISLEDSWFLATMVMAAEVAGL
jgi:hypothetical protein